MNRLIEISTRENIPANYQNTPIGLLLEYHNLNRSHDQYNSAQLFIGMCMDNRKHLKIPENFSYIIRSGGANLRFSEFKVSYAIGVGGIKHIALIGHNNCGMVNLAKRKQEFVNGLIENAGWEKEFAEEHFQNYAPLFEIGNEIDFILTETIRLRNRYPKITVVPMLYLIENNLLYLIDEKIINNKISL